MRTTLLPSVHQPIILIEVEKPQPKEGQVLVKIHAAALNHRDVWIQKGLYPGTPENRILGSDGSGVVEVIGSGVDSSWHGKSVIINPGLLWGDVPEVQNPKFYILGHPDAGTFAEYVVVPASQLYDKPAHLSFEEAAALPLAGVTAYRAAFTRGGLQRGEKVLVTGIGGGVALFAMQFAIAAGAEVWVTSSSEEKINHAKVLGAEGGFNYRDSQWTKAAKAEAGAFNLIVDGAAGEHFAQLLEVAAPAGRIVIYGQTAGPVGTFNAGRLFWKQVDIKGSTMGSPQDFEAMLELVNRQRIVPVVDKVFPLEQAEQAFRHMEAHAQFGKIVLRVV